MAVQKKKIVPPSSPLLVPGRDFDTHAIVKLIDDARTLADDYETVIEQIEPSMTCPQRVMRAALLGGKLSEQSGRFEKLFKLFADQHRKGEGGFMHEADQGESLVVVGFETSGGAVAPKWKDEAIRLGRELALARAEEFDEDRFETEVRSRYAPNKTSLKIQITEVA